MKTVYHLTVLFVLSIILNSCLDEFQGDSVIVNTEDILELNSEDVTLLGRLITSTGQPSELGFYLDTNEDFSNPQILTSNGDPGLGAFISSSNNLDFETQYYTKAYAVVDGQLFFGETISFATNVPSIFSVNPLDGPIGSTVTINGLNITDDVEVFFGSEKAEIVSLANKSVLNVLVPEISGDIEVDIELVMNGTSFVFDFPFTYHTGSWTRLSEFPIEDQLTGCVVIEKQDQMIIGYGRGIIDGILNNAFYSYNKSNDSWSSFPSPEFADAVSDPINYGFGFGGGNIEIGLFGFQSRQSWMLDNSLSWIAYPPLTISALFSAVFTELNGLDYIFGGILPDNSTSNFSISSGDVESSNFNTVAIAPFRIVSSEAHFTYDGKFYYQSDAFTISCFDPETNLWSEFYNASINLGSSNIASVIDDKVLIGLGSNGAFIYEIDLRNKSTIRKNVFIGAPDEENVAHWVADNKLYVLRTAFTLSSTIQGRNQMTVWELDPKALKQL